MRSWNIIRPENMSLEYKYVNQGFFGDGERFVKFQLPLENNDFSLFPGKSKKIELIFNQITKEINYKKINFQEDYEWKVYLRDLDDSLYLLYFPHSKELYILQITT